ncbi:cAMP-dependent protein kinase regulator, partial [Tremellales sp. Uapishka_1]
MPSYSAILNDLNRDVAKEQPKDVIQFCADWFQERLRTEVSIGLALSRDPELPSPCPSSQAHNHSQRAGTPTSPAPRKGPGNLPAFRLPAEHDLGPSTLSPFSEHGPSDSPFGGPRRATIAAASGSVFSNTSMFSSPFGAPPPAGPPAGESSPWAGTAPSQLFSSSPFGQAEEHHDEPVVPSYALGRRTSVSAESLVPANHRPYDPSANGIISEEDETTPNPNSVQTPVFPKTEEQLARIKAAIKPNFLFRNLDEEQEADVLAAMKEVTIPAGEMIIEQGAAGDYFYVVESGKLDVYVKKDGQLLDPEKGDRQLLGRKVHTCVEGNSFGELALMHNAPRAASIVSLTPCTLWALDRVSFRTILLDHTSRKRRLYESFLSTVSILSSLQPYERAKIADVLESQTFQEGEDVITEGDAGEEFFLIESGIALAIKRDANGKETVVKQLGKGDYFGELALINRQTRAATIRAAGADGDKLRVAALGEQAFTRLLGPVKDIMARSVGERYGLAAGR